MDGKEQRGKRKAALAIVIAFLNNISVNTISKRTFGNGSHKRK